MTPQKTVDLGKVGNMSLNNSNIEYYNKHAEEFFNGTVNADMSLWRDKFENYVSQGGRILDAGCGSGRDSKAFKQHGFSVVAFDASREMCRMASEFIGQEVWQMRFDEISFDDEFNGIWACASLLHVPEEELANVFSRLNKALVNDGVMYASFKYGEGRMTKGERSFINFTEKSVKDLFADAGFNVLEVGITTDVRLGRDDEKWVNVIGRKIKK